MEYRAVKILADINWPSISARQGDVRDDLDPSVARGLVEGGWAEPVKPVKRSAKPKAEPKAATGKKGRSKK